jgi:NAD(P)-dependent dehydrogenase (short-subunit alcohol dehydrogenase family)
MAGQRTIIVTGASRGIGHATALRFHAEGDLSDLGEIARCVARPVRALG